MFLSRLRFGSPNSLQTIEPGSKWEEWRGKPTKKGPKRRWRVNVSCATSKFFFLVFLHFTYADNNFSNYYSSLGQVYDGLAITNNICHNEQRMPRMGDRERGVTMRHTTEGFWQGRSTKRRPKRRWRASMSLRPLVSFSLIFISFSCSNNNFQLCTYTTMLPRHQPCNEFSTSLHRPTDRDDIYTARHEFSTSLHRPTLHSTSTSTSTGTGTNSLREKAQTMRDASFGP